jgi:capsular exopolysaccharide synthesis family protein
MNSLLFARERGSQPLKVIVVTSPEPGDGKTSVASNLAIALSQIDRRVLLIDGDLRRPRLTRIFDMEERLGLVELLANATASEPPPLCSTYIPQLSVLPSGNRHAFESKLLHSSGMGDLIHRVRDEFDLVIIDSPPLLRFSDARVLARWADGVLLVFRSRKTTLETAVGVQRCFMEDGTRVVGTILNDWNPKHSTNFRAYKRSYAYSRTG